ncbi:MAG: thiol protease/hemagglutinin PrtT [Bacteroidales bacterium]|nr:thiol protease/hemagglutinin PrtT [Bacteroidales bacterium]MCF8458084.1 thiol protease/hemagglutinin PrtT [Bacteroidales bacterium]
MKRILFLIAIVFGLINLSIAKKVDPETAKKVADNYLNGCLKHSNTGLTLVYRFTTNDILGYTSSGNDEHPLIYVFNTGTNNGFVLIAGDDNSVPVLGYSTTGSFDKDNIPINFRKWIEGYKKELEYIIANNTEAPSETKDHWAKLIRGTSTENKGTDAVNPLLSTTWSQSPYYNALCPGGSVTGCVATAMAQIMNFWEHPVQGSGFHSYNEDDYGTLSANFGSTTYQWSSMPNNVSGPNSAVATLMYHCGVSVDMNYSPQSSGAYVISSQSPVTHCSEYAFTTYFGYDTSVEGKERANYSSSSWIQLLKTELNAGRPIEYAGFGTGGGHAFVCDGYDNNDYFHFNWGWGGAYDGYFLVDALNPSGTGTGGGTGSYNSGQQVVIGIKPPTSSQNADMKLYDYVSLSVSSIWYGDAFDVNTNIWNDGTGNFSGDYCAAVFDNSFNFIDNVEVMTGMSLQAGYVYTNNITFSTAGMLSMLPGDYYIGIFYRPTGGNWIQVSDNGSYTNMIPISVSYASNIELNSAISVTPGTTLTQGQSASVNFNILNDGTTTFYGDYAIDLYDLDGSWVEEIGVVTESNGLPPGYTYTAPYITLSTTSITAGPGTYLMAVTHLPSGGSWVLSGSSYYQNPISVIVQEAQIQADIYESNNTETAAYNLPVNFAGNNASILTTGSNIHTVSDYDYYKIVLPSGYDYSIEARVHDAYNSGNGQTYTNDVLWSFSSGVSWSNAIDDIMASNIDVQNGGTVKFHVAPYFQGETGTYLLDLQVTRSPTIGISEEPNTDNFAIFPNPTSDHIFIENGRKAGIESISIVDISGKTIKRVSSFENQNNIVIPVLELAQGSYFMLIKTEDSTLTWMFIKSE